MTLPEDLIFQRKWWWDPIDMEIFKKLETNVQQQLIAISLETQAQMLKTQAAGFEKFGNALKGGR